MKTGWHNIWSNRTNKLGQPCSLQDLINLDGFDTGHGTINEDDWLDYIERVQRKIELRESDSIYEVGCGAGAFLFPFYRSGATVGGCDYSSSLLGIAGKFMPGAKLDDCEAANIPDSPTYDHVISNSVFFYFPTLEYATQVLDAMCEKSERTVSILEVNDLAKEEEAKKIRRGNLTETEYESRYKGLDHLYLSKEFFINFAQQKKLQIEIEDQKIRNYQNSQFRYNVYLCK